MDVRYVHVRCVPTGGDRRRGSAVHGSVEGAVQAPFGLVFVTVAVDRIHAEPAAVERSTDHTDRLATAAAATKTAAAAAQPDRFGQRFPFPSPNAVSVGVSL